MPEHIADAEQAATVVARQDPGMPVQIGNIIDVHGKTAVFGAGSDALYFSKEVLPFADRFRDTGVTVFHHVGCYAYRPDALRAYMDMPRGPLEQAEGLEQLRFLENGVPVRCVEVDARGRAFWELNNPSDIPLIEDIMQREGIA